MSHAGRTLLCGLSLFVVAQSVAVGQPEGSKDYPDKVVLATDSGGRIARRCLILDYTGRSVTIRTATASEPASYPATDVLEVETPLSAPQIRAAEHEAAGRDREAVAQYEAALQEESRETGRAWVRREILAKLVRGALRLGDESTARSRFVLLFRSDTTTRHFPLIPLVWSPRPIDAPLREEARQFFLDRNEAIRLMGTSLLLEDVELGVLAQEELRRLTGASDLRVRFLAEAQQWRLRMREVELHRDEVVRWERKIEAGPAELRGGPYYLLGRAWQRRNEPERAARAWLWLPLVYDGDATLAARAAVEAAAAWQSIGRQTDATALHREVLRRFANVPSAKEAKAALADRPDDTGAAAAPPHGKDHQRP